MGRPPVSAAQTATPERLLEAAEGVFSDVGFSEAKLADIAARAGITRPSLLYHFGSKEDLYTATVERAFGRLAVALAEAMHARGSFAVRLGATVGRYADFVASEPRIARIVLRELLDQTGPGARILIERVVPLVDEVERFVLEQGAAVVRMGLPVRAAILQLASDILLRAAAGPLREPLWGREDHTETLARVLFLEESSS